MTTAHPVNMDTQVETDETRAPAGSKGRKRRPAQGLHRRPATPMRFAADVGTALEAEARETGRSKVAIVEGELRDRYGLQEPA